MPFLAGLAARILGPKIIAAVPWRLLAVLALLAGIGGTYWYVNDHAYDRAKKADATLIAGLRTDITTANASTQSLIDAWGRVDAAINDWQARRDKDVADAHAAAQTAQKRYADTSALVARLSRPASPAANIGRPAPYSDEEVAAWSALSH